MISAIWRKCANLMLVLVSFLVPLLLIEGAASLINRGQNVKLPFLYHSPAKSGVRAASTRFTTIDSLLGHAWNSDSFRQTDILVLENGVIALSDPLGQRTLVKDGFAFHPLAGKDNVPEQVESLPRPFILILGGSTSQSLRSNGIASWPEHLAAMLRQEGVTGTLVNGALSGYASNQELLKLIRDGMTLMPDLVISYHGVNDAPHMESRHPLKVPYLHKTLERMVRNEQGALFLPNTVYLLRSMGKDRKGVQNVTAGLASTRPLAESFAHNVRLMDAVLDGFGIAHISILQPFAFTGNRAEANRKTIELDQDARDTLALYEGLAALKREGRLPMRDFTAALDDYPGDAAYYDWCHIVSEANLHLARKIRALLPEEIFKREQDLAAP